MGKLYRLSPEAFTILGYVCCALVVVVLLLFLYRVLQTNTLRFIEHKRETAQSTEEEEEVSIPINQTNVEGNDDDAATTNDHDNNIKSTCFQRRDVILVSLFQTLIFGMHSLGVMFYLKTIAFRDVTVWPLYIFFIFAFLAAADWFRRRYPIAADKENNNTRKAKRRSPDVTLAEIFVAYFALQFFALAAQRCFHLVALSGYDYHGPVRVVGYSESYIGRDGRSNRLPHLQKYYFKCPVDEAVGQIEVAWGGKWACPQHDSHDKQCTATVNSFDCDFTVCESCNGETCSLDEYNTTLQASNTCVQTYPKFRNSWTLLEQGIRYNSSIPPWDDSQEFSTVTMYVECDTCKAEFEDIIDQQRHDVPQGIIIAYGVVLVICGVLYGKTTIYSSQTTR
jgi:hypothetical protein